jgi:hypothetical protein
MPTPAQRHSPMRNKQPVAVVHDVETGRAPSLPVCHTNHQQINNQ